MVRLVSLCLSVAVVFAVAQPAESRGKTSALVVGVNEYTSPSLTDLSYAENDAEEVAKELKSAGYEVTLLTTRLGKKVPERMPTAANIRAALASLIKGRGPADTVVVCLAGHGVQQEVDDPKGKEEPRKYTYFCPRDFSTSDIQFSTGNGEWLINLNWLFGQLEHCDAGRKVVLVDACRNLGKRTTATRNIDLKRVTVPDGVCALFSCSPGQVAYEIEGLGGRGHGVFFHFVLEGLRGKAKNADGEVTWGGLSEYVTRQVGRETPKLTGRPTLRQTPHQVANLLGESPVLIAPRPAAVGKRYALLVGIDDYSKAVGNGGGLSDLDYTVADAKGLSDVLKAQGFVVTLLTEGATAANTRSAIKTVLADRGPNDLVFVGLAGWGTEVVVSDPGRKGDPRAFTLFLPADADMRKSDYRTGFTEKAISVDEVLEAFASSKAGVKVAMVDAERRNGGENGRGVRVAPAKLTLPKGCAVLFTASEGQGVVWPNKLIFGDKYKHSFYYQALIDGLSGKARDTEGDITLDGLIRYTRTTLGAILKDAKVPKEDWFTPELLSNVPGPSPVLVPGKDSGRR